MNNAEEIKNNENLLLEKVTCPYCNYSYIIHCHHATSASYGDYATIQYCFKEND